MKTYISDQITGLTYEQAYNNFSENEAFIESIGMDPVNPMRNGLPFDADWKAHMLKDIEMLMECDAIMMGHNWKVSKGARIEKKIAEEMGLTVFYKTICKTDKKQIVTIKKAIEEATGLCFRQYTTKSRKREGFYSRMIFTNLCSQMCEDVTIEDIAGMLERNTTSVRRYLNKFEDEMKVNREFRSIVKAVRINLTNNVSE
jgi:hypothetical protein